MQKNDVIAAISQTDISEDLKQDLLQAVSGYADILTPEQEQEFSTLIDELQDVELKSSFLLEDAANVIDDMLDKQVDARETAVKQSVQTMRNGLTYAEAKTGTTLNVDE